MYLPTKIEILESCWAKTSSRTNADIHSCICGGWILRQAWKFHSLAWRSLCTNQGYLERMGSHLLKVMPVCSQTSSKTGARTVRSFWGVGVDIIMGTLAVRREGLDADILAEARREAGRAEGMWNAAAPWRATSRSTPAVLYADLNMSGCEAGLVFLKLTALKSGRPCLSVYLSRWLFFARGIFFNKALRKPDLNAPIMNKEVGSSPFKCVLDMVAVYLRILAAVQPLIAFFFAKLTKSWTCLWALIFLCCYVTCRSLPTMSAPHQFQSPSPPPPPPSKFPPASFFFWQASQATSHGVVRIGCAGRFPSFSITASWHHRPSFLEKLWQSSVVPHVAWLWLRLELVASTEKSMHTGTDRALRRVAAPKPCQFMTNTTCLSHVCCSWCATPPLNGLLATNDSVAHGLDIFSSTRRDAHS